MILALGLALSSAPAFAVVPSTTSYQGVLADGAGNIVPDGTYDLTFRLYLFDVGGSPAWTETQAGVTVNRGGFSVVLGSVTPLEILFDWPYYLGVSVNGGAELTPRVALTPVPQALALRLPYVGLGPTSTTSFVVANDGGGYAIGADPGFIAGSLLNDGVYVAWGPSSIYGTAIFEAGPNGGDLWIANTSGQAIGLMVPNFATAAGELRLMKGNSTRGIRMIGDVSGSEDPYVLFDGASRDVLFDTRVAGDGGVQLPASSISSAEILDEPGVAQGHGSSSVVISTSTTVTDLVSVTITTPAAGYIEVEADGMHGIGGNGSVMNEAELTIKDSSGGGMDYSRYTVSGFTSAAPFGVTRIPISLRRTYFKPAGTYSFYFQARANNPGSFSNYVWQPTITATFVPTSYGAVVDLLSGGDAVRDGLAGTSVAVTVGPGGERSDAGAVQVDLRELELRAARLREAAAKAEVELMRATTAAAPAPRRIAAASKDGR